MIINLHACFFGISGSFLGLLGVFVSFGLEPLLLQLGGDVLLVCAGTKCDWSSGFSSWEYFDSYNKIV